MPRSPVPPLPPAASHLPPVACCLPPAALCAQPVVLDHLGPIVVNSDGTLARIANWDELSEQEQSVAKRRIAKRNIARLEGFRQTGDLKAEFMSALPPQPPT